ncbi:MAG: HAD-IIB family hydrolase [Planctomycetota bacterium]|nr:HAD-IIB family hydrolase [Planctomycetota bacterium]
MMPLNEAPLEMLAGIRVVMTDIDDTISTDGKLRPEAFDALWQLHDAGLIVIPVTGRPAGWCDHIARFWPVDAVVGENGGFYFYHDGRKLRRQFFYDERKRREDRQRLEKIRDTILREVPGCNVASDQGYREYDLAIDFCEDVEPLPREAVLRIKRIFEEAGAQAKISSIHVNGWFGQFDKLSMVRRCLLELFGMDVDAQNDVLAICGDSPNDESLFRSFRNSFGMANIVDFADLLEYPPAYITTQRGGGGFREVADSILRARRA